MKQILVKEEIAEYLSSIKINGKCTAGIIIGTKSHEGKQILVRLSKSPSQNDKDYSSIKDIEHSWVAGHAFQCTNYLPGGVDVIGVFLISSDSTQKESQAFLKQAITGLYKLELKESLNHVADKSEVNLLTVHISNSSGNVLSCKQFNVADYKDTGTHVEWKYHSKIPTLNCVQTSVDLNFSIGVNIDNEKYRESFLANFYSNIKSYLAKFDKAYLEHNGNVKSNAELFEKFTDSHKKGGKGKHKQVKPTQQKLYHCDLLLPCSNENVSVCTPQNFNQVLTCKGKLLAICYWPTTILVADILVYLAEDISRSIRQRCELIHDDVTQDSNEVIFPKRVIGQSDEDGICYSDYIFQDETFKDCESRIKDALDADTTACETEETHPVVDQVKFENIPEKVENVAKIETESSGNLIPAVIAICSASIVGAMAWLMSNLEM